MSEYYFAASRDGACPSRRVAARRDRIAGNTCPGAGYIRVETPEGLRAWGYLPNLGSPCDDRRAREIETAWAAAGI